MKINKIIIAFFSLALLAVLAVVIIFFNQDIDEIPVSFIADFGERKEKITCFQNKEGEYYVFLPSFCDITDVELVLETQGSVKIDGKEIHKNMSCKGLKTDKEYTLQFKAFGKDKINTIVFLRSQNIPAMYIDTKSGNMDYIHQKKGNSEKGTIRTYTADGRLDFIGNLTSINGRGNSTWDGYEKKPYSFSLNNSADLLGLGKAYNWVLLSNATDDSHIRNKLAFDFAKGLGLEYTADSVWVDLYLNGEYVGLYLLCERNEIGENRIDISNDAFLVSLELEERLKAQNYNYVTTKYDLAYRIHYPKNANTKSKNSIVEKLQSVENAALSKNGIDLESGKTLDELIDYNSWVRKYLVDEILGNFDGGYLSQYLYLNNDSKVYAGPVWDYDRAMGNELEWFTITNPNVFVFNRYINGNEEKNNPVLENLAKTDGFLSYGKKVFREECVEAIDEILTEKIPEYTTTIKKSAELNAFRWSNADFDFNAEISVVSNYLKEHTNFLYRVWIEGEDVCQIAFVGLENDLFYSVSKGETLSEIPTVKNTEHAIFKGFYYSDTNEPFDKTKPITEDTEVYAKWENKNDNPIKTVIKYSPILLIAVIFIVLITIDFKRNKWGGGNE